MRCAADRCDLRPHAERIARRLLGEPNKQLSTRSQLRFGTNGSVAVEITGGKRGQWYDHEAAVGGGPWELLTVKGRMTNGDAVEWLQSELGIDIERGAQNSRRIVATYDYRDEAGALLFQVCRFDPKDFRQRRPDGNGGWTWRVKGVRQVPYRLPDLIATPLDTSVFVVEGEKDANNLAALGLAATCNAGGAAKRRDDGKPGRPKWRAEFNPFFQGRDVIVVPDNDDAGRDHASAVAAHVAPVAARVRILELPALPPKGDVSAWLDGGGTRDELLRLAAETPEFQPQSSRTANPQVPELDEAEIAAEVTRLAHLKPIAYERERTTAARRLSVRAAILDRLVKAERVDDATDAPGQGRPLDLPESEPWGEPVDGAELLDGLASTLREYVIVSDTQADAVALWNVHSHAHDASDVSPKLVLKSPQKRSGKSRLAEALERTAARPLYASGIKAAALLRVIEMSAPTLLLDEMDSAMKQDRQMAEALRGIINSGFNRAGARYIMNVPTADGGFEPRQFSTWAPQVLSGIGDLPDTVRDRSIEIEMKRKRADEKVKRLRRRDGEDLRVLGRKSARWARDNLTKLAGAPPDTPAGLNDRAADAWEPLFAIADLAGGNWPLRARKAALALSGEASAEDDNIGTMLLSDIRAIFSSEDPRRLGIFDTPEGLAIYSEKLAEALALIEGRPWGDHRNGKPITPTSLALLLKPYKVRPADIRSGDRVKKGYHCGQFTDVFERYVVGATATPLQPAETLGLESEGRPQQGSACSGLGEVEKPQNSAPCSGVADREILPAEGNGLWMA